MLSDRRATYGGLDLPLGEALAAETDLAARAKRLEAAPGAARFAAGAGRHGSLDEG